MSKFSIAALPRWLRDFAPLFFWMVLLFVLSSRPVLLEIENEAGNLSFYKFAHMIAYAVLTWLWWRAISPQRKTTWPIVLTALGLTILFGISDEIHQLFVPGRHGRIADVLFDSAGALMMILLIRHVKWLRNFPESASLFQEYSPERVKSE